MNDSTGFSCDHVVNQFCSMQSTNAALTPEEFFQNHSESNARNFTTDVVIADIRNRIEAGAALDIEAYFGQFPELKQKGHAWRVLQAAEPWLIENEGANWKDNWAERLPLDCFPSKIAPGSNLANATGATSPLNFDDLKQGDRILHFVIDRLVGKGTHGVVYQADNVKLARDVALKIATIGGNEGRALARLNHANIVRVYGQHEVGHKRILEMEFVDGSSLDKWISYCQHNSASACSVQDYRQWVTDNSTYPQQPEQDSEFPGSVESLAQVAVWITLQLAGGLTHAHQRGILHQDIKPANVLIDSKGKPLLTDFNVAFIDGLGRNEGVGGTINYMSPEHLRAFCSGDPDLVDAIDLRADIYSLGLVLLELLKGDKLWGNSPSVSPQALAGELLDARQSGPPERIRQLPGVDHSLSAIVEKALQPKVENRYQTAGEFATDLSNWLKGFSNLHARNPSYVELSTKFLRRRKLEAISILTAATICMAAFLGWLFVENSSLYQCENLLAKVQNSLAEGRGTSAAEQLGIARTQLDQLWISAWLQRDRLERNLDLVEKCSDSVKQFETYRFSSLFGQASLLGIHEEEQQEIRPLVEKSLKSFGVMSHLDWQKRPPFSELSSGKQSQIARHITELMFVSMIHSRKDREPSAEQWDKVLQRLPDQYRGLEVFREIRSGKQLMAPTKVEEMGSFEMYLRGVWSTDEGNDQAALAWYNASLRNQQADSREDFWLRYRLGLSAHRVGLLEEAVVHYNVCLGLKPDFAWIPFNLALVYAKGDEPIKAKKFLRRTIYLDPEMSAAYQALATLHLESSEFEQAINICQQAEKAKIKSPALTRLSESARNMLEK